MNVYCKERQDLQFHWMLKHDSQKYLIIRRCLSWINPVCYHLKHIAINVIISEKFARAQNVHPPYVKIRTSNDGFFALCQVPKLTRNPILFSGPSLSKLIKVNSLVLTRNSKEM